MKKFVLKSLAFIFMAQVFALPLFAAEPRNIVFLRHDGHANFAGENVVADALRAHFATDNVIEILNPQIELFPASRLDTLRNASVIIIARAVGSWNWTAAGRDIWHTITTPVLSTNAFAVRSGQLAWTPTSVAAFGGTAADLTTLFMARVTLPNDPVMAGIVVTPDSLVGLWTRHWTILGLDVAVPNNAEVVLERQNNPIDGNRHVVLARWAAGVPFFEGGATPAGHRSYMGLGADGDATVNYWGWNFDGHDIFMREIERLMALPRIPASVPGAPLRASVSVSPNPVVDNLVVRMNGLASVRVIDVTGKLVKSVDASGSEVTVNLSGLPGGVYFIKAADSNNNVVVERVIKR